MCECVGVCSSVSYSGVVGFALPAVSASSDENILQHSEKVLMTLCSDKQQNEQCCCLSPLSPIEQVYRNLTPTASPDVPR